MKEKLWSPGKARKVLIVWYEDDDGPGNMSVYYHKVEAEGYIRDLVRDVAGDALGELNPDEQEERDLLKFALKNLDKDVWSALFSWAEYEALSSTDKKIHVEEAVLYGA